MRRKALVVGDAIAIDDALVAALQRFGFGPAERAESLTAAVQALREGHFDFVFVPLGGLTPADLAALEREIRRSPSTFVIGTAAHADPSLILSAMRSGIHEFLVHPASTSDVVGAVDRLLRRDASEGEQGMVVAVYGAKGGLGNTTLAVNLAFALARNRPDGRVALGDLVVSGGDVRILLDIKPAYDISDLIEKVDRVDADLLFSLLTAYPNSGVWVLPSSESGDVSDVVDGNAAAGMIAQLRSHFAYTVLDCEHHVSERTLAALDAADRIVLVTQLGVAALRSTQRTLDLCERLGYGPEKVRVVVNRQNSGDVMTVADASDVLQREIFWSLPNDYRTASAALAKGIPVSALENGAPLASSYAELAAKLVGGVRAATVGGNGQASASRFGRLLSFGRKK